MPVLKSLSFTILPRHGNDPVQTRRAKFVAKLEEQRLVLQDPNHVRTVQRWTKVNGERQAITKQQVVRPWWKTDPSGRVVMSVKFGAKPIEFEKGMAGIVVGSKDKLPSLIDALIAAVRAGELDDLLGQAAKTGAMASRRRLLDHQSGRASYLPGSSTDLLYLFEMTIDGLAAHQFIGPDRPE